MSTDKNDAVWQTFEIVPKLVELIIIRLGSIAKTSQIAMYTYSEDRVISHQNSGSPIKMVLSGRNIEIEPKLVELIIIRLGSNAKN